MKIFPLKPLSNYDRFQNLVKFLDNNNKSGLLSQNTCKLEVEKNSNPSYQKRTLFEGLIEKFSRVSALVAKIKGNYGKKSIIN